MCHLWIKLVNPLPESNGHLKGQGPLEEIYTALAWGPGTDQSLGKAEPSGWVGLGLNVGSGLH